MITLVPCVCCGAELLDIPYTDIQQIAGELACKDCAEDVADIAYQVMVVRGCPESLPYLPSSFIAPIIPTHPKNHIQRDGYPAPVAPKAPRRSMWARFLDGLWRLASLLDGGDGC